MPTKAPPKPSQTPPQVFYCVSPGSGSIVQTMATDTVEPSTVTPIVTPSRSPRSRALPPEVKELAKALYLQGLRPSAIQEELNVTPATLRQWAKRYNWGRLRQNTQAVIVTRQSNGLAREAAATISEQSSRIRSMLGREVEAQAKVLEAQAPASIRELGNTPQRQGRTAVVKALAETAATVFDWDAQHAPGLIVIGEIERADPSPDTEPVTIDVASVTVKDESAQVPNGQQ